MIIVTAILILSVHLGWIVWVIFGALFTRGRPCWSMVHILALAWGIIVEAGPWPCPLTLVEQYFETGAGLAAYQGSFLLHTLDAVVYPNISPWVVTAIGVGVCAFNLGIYLSRIRTFLLGRRNLPANHA
jgi:hypothetical protein